MQKSALFVAAIWLALTCPGAADAQQVRVLGRSQPGADGDFEIQWSGSGFETRFEGKRLTVTIEDTGKNWLNVSLDGKVTKLALKQGVATYQLVDGANAKHSVRVTRRTAAGSGITRFVSITSDGKLLATPAPDRRMLVIGDSISAGYGVEGLNRECSFTYETQNHDATYGALAARNFGADIHTIAIDGRGLIRNYANAGGGTMAALSQQTLADRGSVWNAARYAPQVIVVMLGVNDFSDGDPGAGFDAAYETFLIDLRRSYPQAWIFGAFGTMLYGERYDAARDSIRGAVEKRKAAGDRLVSFIEFTPPDTPRRWGCDWHPGLDAHDDMARTLQDEISRRLAWKPLLP